MEIIELDKNGLAYVPVFIKPKDKYIYRQILFKLDTGAGITTISKKSLNLLGFNDDWIKNNTVIGPIKEVSSAGIGFEPAHCTVLQRSTLLGKTLNNWPYYVRPENDRDYRNLLGVDILSHFEFTFSYKAGTLSIEPNENPVIKLPMLPDQSIDELEADL